MGKKAILISSFRPCLVAAITFSRTLIARLATNLKSVCSWIWHILPTIRGRMVDFVVIVLLLIIVALVTKELSRNPVKIEPFSTPEIYACQGYTGQVLANRLVEKLIHIQQNCIINKAFDATYYLRPDQKTTIEPSVEEYQTQSELNTITFEVAGTGITLDTFCEALKGLFGRRQKRVVCEVTCSPEDNELLQLTVRLDGKLQNSTNCRFNGIDQALLECAEYISLHREPIVLASYYYNTDESDEKIRCIETIKQIIDKGTHKDAIDAYFFWADILQFQRKYEESIAKLEEVMNLEPERELSCVRKIGVIKHSQGKYDEAILEYKKALQLKPNARGIYNSWAKSLNSKGSHSEAVEKCRIALRRDPKNVAALVNCGIALYRLKRYSAAEEKFKRAIDIAPEYALPYYNWGNLLSDQKRWKEAIVKYQQALQVRPDFEWAHIACGNCLVEIENEGLQSAIIQYQKAKKINPRNPAAYLKMGYTLIRFGKYDQAIDQYRAAIEIEPNNKYAYNEWGIALKHLEDYDGAIDKYKTAIDIDPNFSAPYGNWGKALFLKKNYGDAIAKLEKAIALDPDLRVASKADLVQAYFHFGTELYEQQENLMAAYYLRKALQIDPTGYGVQCKLGLALSKLGDFGEALEHLRIATEINPKLAQAYYEMAEIKRQQGKHEEAKQLYWKAIDLDTLYNIGAMGPSRYYPEFVGRVKKPDVQKKD